MESFSAAGPGRGPAAVTAAGVVAAAGCSTDGVGPESVPRRFVAISAGGDHTCALDAGGVAYCWGSDSRGQLGIGSRDSSTEPVPVAGDLAFTHLDAGTVHTCGTSVDGGIWCWGYDRFGQLGPDSPGGGCGRSRCASIPVRVPGLEAHLLDAGGLHTCIVAADGAYCWGANLSGELGGGPALASGPAGGPAHRAPVRVTGAPAFRSLSLGEHHSCGLTAQGTAYCWGNGGYGQVGSGVNGRAFPAPTAVAGSHGFTGLSAGMHHTCGVTAAGEAYCWGDNRAGQLGDGTLTGAAAPRPIGGG